MSKDTAPTGFDPEQFKVEIAEQTRTIIREIMAEERIQGRQEPQYLKLVHLISILRILEGSNWKMIRKLC